MPVADADDAPDDAAVDVDVDESPGELHDASSRLPVTEAAAIAVGFLMFSLAETSSR